MEVLGSARVLTGVQVGDRYGGDVCRPAGGRRPATGGGSGKTTRADERRANGRLLPAGTSSSPACHHPSYVGLSQGAADRAPWAAQGGQGSLQGPPVPPPGRQSVPACVLPAKTARSSLPLPITASSATRAAAAAAAACTSDRHASYHNTAPTLLSHHPAPPLSLFLLVHSI